MSGQGLTGANYGAGTSGGGLITSSTPGTGPAVPGMGGFGVPSARTEATEADLIANYGSMSEILRKSLAQQLKSAGYKVPVTGNYNTTVREAFLDASRNLSSEISMLQANDPQRLSAQKFDITSYLKDIADTRAGMGSGDGGPSIRKDIRISDETTARTLINTVLQDALGRGATKEELEKYTSALQKAQKASPTVTTYSTVGDVQTSTTTPGLNEEQFLIQQIAGTDEAKANKVFGYYDAFKNALGVR
jgi:hypothetical protein